MTGPRRARANRFERHRGPVLLAFAAGLALTTDVAATLVRHGLGSNQYTLSKPVEQSYRISSWRYHHDLRPNVSVPNASWGPLRYLLKTNSLGFKDASNREVPLKGSRHRVVFIGDSFTEGVGIPYERTWVGLVDQRLAREGIEVLNAGVCTYAPSIYYAKVDHLLNKVGLRFDELAVYIDISDAQDEVVTYRLREDGRVMQRLKDQRKRKMPRYTQRYFARTSAVERFIGDNTSVARFLMLGLAAGQLPPPRAQLDPVADLFRSGWTYDREAFEWYGRPGLAHMTAAMDLLAGLAKEHRFRLTVGVYPWPGQVMYDIPDSKQARHWRDWAARHDAGFVSHFPDFLQEGQRAQNVERYFLPGDFHWNEAGHRRMAEGYLRARKRSQTARSASPTPAERWARR